METVFLEKWAVGTEPDLTREAYALPCVRLEVRVAAPWVSNAPEPAVA